MKKTKVKVLHSKSYLKQKLMAATAMLLIASILMVSATYAWFVMSTAPEVSNIKTQVGANGALELALLNSDSWENLDLLDYGDIDESALDSDTNANLSWGNLVNLSDSSYGLSQITLQPARLAITQSGTDTDGSTQYAVNSTMLKVPVYGEDGRIQSLDTTSAVAYVYNGASFSSEGYGVRAIGTSAEMSQFQLALNTARSQIANYTAAARTHASQAVQQNGNDLANIAADYALSGKDSGYTDDNVKTIRALAVGLQTALDDLDDGLHQAFAGYLTTSASGLTDGTYQAAYDEIGTLTLSELLAKYPGITTVIPNMSAYVTTLNNDVAKVANAITACDGMTGNNYTWAQISSILSPLVDPNAMTLGGQKLADVKASVKNEDGSINFSAAMALVSNGIVIGVPSGTGILADIADYAGDYTASVTIAEVSYAGQTLTNTPAKIATETTANPVYLTACSNNLKSADTIAAEGSNAMTDFYGYALDLAFRTNASGSSLMLQTESENRVYSDENNAALQGGGSYMTFTTNSVSMSATKMVKLMSAIRVVLMDESRNILGIATLDMTLGKDVYTVVTDDANSYYLDDGTEYQQSDVITKAEYDKLADTSAVTIDKTAHTISAKLYLHEFSMTESTNHTAEETADGTKYYTGGITIGAKKTSAAITSLVQDTVQRVTALVYLDGSVVTNATVSADSTQSMTGTLNLQFSSSATLIPAENTALRNIGSSDASDDAETTPTMEVTQETGEEAKATE